jgi:hypothetical protein
MKNSKSTSTWRAGLPISRKSVKARMSVSGLLFLSLASSLLNPLVFSLPALAQTPAIRGELIGGPAVTNSVSITNPSSKQAGGNFINTNEVASGAIKINASGRADDFVTAGFDLLSGFPLVLRGDIFGPPVDQDRASRIIREKIPVSVRALSEKRVVTQGFMLPMKMKDGLAVDFLLLRNQMACCFGGTPGITEWIQVRTTGKGVKPVMDIPIFVFGTVHVEEIRENGFLSGLYQMDCEKVEAPSSQ